MESGVFIHGKRRILGRHWKSITVIRLMNLGMTACCLGVNVAADFFLVYTLACWEADMCCLSVHVFQTNRLAGDNCKYFL